MELAVSPVQILNPSSVSEAISLLNQHGRDAKIYAGGTDILYQLKTANSNPPRNVLVGGYSAAKYLINIKNIPGLSQISYDSNGLHLGTLVNISDLAESQTVQQNYPVLAQTVSKLASPQLRNMATVGGDLLQQVWCWYVRHGYSCWRNGGSTCYAVIGDNRYYHSIFGGHLCYAVQPGDLPPALTALDAQVQIAGPGGNKSVKMSEFFSADDIIDGVVKSYVLADNEIVTGVTVPKPMSNSKGAFVKARERESIDFALASAAVVLSMSGSTVSDARVVMGGVAPGPVRSTAAEEYLKGKSVDDNVAVSAANTALQNAVPMSMNEFRISIAKGVVRAAILQAASS